CKQARNGLRAISGHRQLYSNAPDYSLAERMCRDDPTLRTGAGDRVRIASFAEQMKSTVLASVHPCRGRVPAGDWTAPVAAPRMTVRIGVSYSASTPKLRTTRNDFTSSRRT